MPEHQDTPLRKRTTSPAMARALSTNYISKNPSEVDATDVVRWIQKTLYVPEGRLMGQTVRLSRWQQDEIRRIYDNDVPTRRAILSFARKNGKTLLAAMLLLLHLCGPKVRPNSNLFSAAQSREQAALIFSLAAKMVSMSQTLRSYIDVKETTKELFCRAWGTRYRALSAEANTALGLSPVFVVHDELGQVHGPRNAVYGALETATGAQEDPLTVIISTQAPRDEDLLSILIDDALGAHDPSTVCKLYTAPLQADPFDIETIKQANPALDDFMNRKEVLNMAEDARRMPAREPEFRNLILNQRVESLSPFINTSLWQACGQDVKSIDNTMVYGGLDLSEVRDLTALVLIGMVDKVWQVHPTFWLPDIDLRTKTRQDRVPYDLWHQQGHLNTCPGKSVSYEYVAQYLRDVFSQYRIAKIGFDRWNMKHLKPWLTKAGFSEQDIANKFVEFGQGTQSMSPALRELESLILDEKVAHGNHPVLGMCAANAVVEGKDSSNRKLSKMRSSGRIDGMVALAMAIGVAPQGRSPIDIEALIG